MRDPNRFAAVNELTDNPTATATRLQALVACITTEAASGRPDAVYYGKLAENLADPNWDGVLLFNATVAPPAPVQGHPTPQLPTPMLADVVGFDVTPVRSSSPADSPLFATVNLPAGSTAPGGQYLRAPFQDSALTAYAASTSPSRSDH